MTARRDLGEVAADELPDGLPHIDDGKQAPPKQLFAPFPIEALPLTVQGFVNEATASIGCDSSYVILPMLSVLASAVAVRPPGSTSAISPNTEPSFSEISSRFTSSEIWWLRPTSPAMIKIYENFTKPSFILLHIVCGSGFCSRVLCLC